MTARACGIVVSCRGPRNLLDHDVLISRRRALTGAAAAIHLASTPAWAIGKANQVGIGVIRHDGGHDHRNEAYRRLLWEVSKRTSIDTAADATVVNIDDDQMFFHPLLVLTGERAFTPFTAAQRTRLSKHLRTGGLLWVDGARDGGFIAAAEQELAQMFADAPMRMLAPDHVLTKSFFLVPQAVGKDEDDGRLRGIEQGGRSLVVMTRCDVLGAYERDRFGTWRYECTPGGDDQRELAFRLGVNIMMVATCLDYKTDQVHIDFIMKKARR
jgi:hypothetical protein